MCITFSLEALFLYLSFNVLLYNICSSKGLFRLKMLCTLSASDKDRGRNNQKLQWVYFVLSFVSVEERSKVRGASSWSQVPKRSGHTAGQKNHQTGRAGVQSGNLRHWWWSGPLLRQYGESEIQLGRESVTAKILNLTRSFRLLFLTTSSNIPRWTFTFCQVSPKHSPSNGNFVAMNAHWF